MPLYKHLFRAKKLVSIMIISLLVNETSKEDYVLLEQMSYIYYLFYFRKNIIGIKALIDLGNEVNIITLAYASKLGLKIYYTNVGAQKIDSSTLKIFGIVLTSFQIEDKINRTRFF